MASGRNVAKTNSYTNLYQITDEYHSCMHCKSREKLRFQHHIISGTEYGKRQEIMAGRRKRQILLDT